MYHLTYLLFFTYVAHLNFGKTDKENTTLMELKNISLKTKDTCGEKVVSNLESGTGSDKVQYFFSISSTI